MSKRFIILHPSPHQLVIDKTKRARRSDFIDQLISIIVWYLFVYFSAFFGTSTESYLPLWLLIILCLCPLLFLKKLFLLRAQLSQGFTITLDTKFSIIQINHKTVYKLDEMGSILICSEPDAIDVGYCLMLEIIDQPDLVIDKEMRKEAALALGKQIADFFKGSHQDGRHPIKPSNHLLHTIYVAGRTITYSYTVKSKVYSRTFRTQYSDCEDSSTEDVSQECERKRFWVIYSKQDTSKSLINLDLVIQDQQNPQFPNTLDDFYFRYELFMRVGLSYKCSPERLYAVYLSSIPIKKGIDSLPIDH